jgi:hypothetical protein
VEHGWIDGVELGANLAVAGNFADTKQVWQFERPWPVSRWR